MKKLFSAFIFVVIFIGLFSIQVSADSILYQANMNSTDEWYWDPEILEFKIVNGKYSLKVLEKSSDGFGRLRFTDRQDIDFDRNPVVHITFDSLDTTGGWTLRCELLEFVGDIRIHVCRSEHTRETGTFSFNLKERIALDDRFDVDEPGGLHPINFTIYPEGYNQEVIISNFWITGDDLPESEIVDEEVETAIEEPAVQVPAPTPSVTVPQTSDAVLASVSILMIGLSGLLAMKRRNNR